MNNKLSILDNGQMSKTFRYNINGKQVLETLDLDIQNGNFAKTKDIFFINPAEGRTKKLPIDPNSVFGKAVLADESGARQTSFLNTMDAISTKVGNQIVPNSSDYEDALRKSGMYNKSRGFESHIGSTFPNTGENVDNTIEEESKDDDIKPKEKKKRSATSTRDYTYPKSPEMHLDQDYMYIEKFKYTPPQQDYLSSVTEGDKSPKALRGQGNQNIRGNMNRRGGNLDFHKGTGGEVSKLVEGIDATSVINKGLHKGSNIGKELLGTVKLPIPNGLSVSQGVNWGEGRVNALEAGAFLGVQNTFSQLIAGNKNLAGVFGAGLEGMKKGLAELRDVGQGGSNTILSSLLAKNTLAQIGVNVDPAQMIARSTGTAINPNLELLFSGPKLRTFKFTFNFAPNDETDAREVRKIMRLFREGMMPHNTATGDKLFLGAPDVFRLSYKNKSKRIKSLNIFKICALTACEINFTPDNQYQSYEDTNAVSMPVRSTMSLTFTELAPIFADDYTGEGDESVSDLGMLVTGENEITEHDIGF